ncbi:helix-turn-helix domain-containing protein [Phenylobacterium sp. 58.2.17]|uniref:helix-turn-helix domain-containing protein n=1 Tax=Phenylobacterium sp. 58.2.17 TaxID=2969306 RepID=UPI0022645F33|nr:helix-turn-helix transcriptional regulator [Phenylobacterium sp. 58.2.17]MCX7587258.1 helix-turn-helix transcriptional regulator [Phenylobacterium sp. 58.2.17]
MPNVIFSDAYAVLPQLLREERLRAGVSKRGLAKLMRRSASHIHMIEARQRRVELIEFCRFIEALGGDPVATFQELRRRLAAPSAP